MTDMESKDAKLNAFLKEQVRTNLLNIGRKLVIEKGRRLSDGAETFPGFERFGGDNLQSVSDDGKFCRRRKYADV